MPFSALMHKFGYLELTPSEVDALCDTFSQRVTFERKSEIIAHGERSIHVSLILSGYACRSKLTEDGKRQIVSFQIPGDILDIQNFVLQFMDHSVEALCSGNPQ